LSRIPALILPSIRGILNCNRIPELLIPIGRKVFSGSSLRIPWVIDTGRLVAQDSQVILPAGKQRIKLRRHLGQPTFQAGKSGRGDDFLTVGRLPEQHMHILPDISCYNKDATGMNVPDFALMADHMIRRSKTGRGPA